MAGVGRYDYIIYAHQRSGTHYVATSLASHPDLSNDGDLNDMDIAWLGGARGKMRGGIVMYNGELSRWCKLSTKIIHLIRDAKSVAVSDLINTENPDLPAHFSKETYKTYKDVTVVEPEDPALHYRTKEVAAQVKYARTWLEQYRDVKEVYYESLPGGFVDMLEYLEVPSRVLTTPLVRNPWGRT